MINKIKTIFAMFAFTFVMVTTTAPALAADFDLFQECSGEAKNSAICKDADQNQTTQNNSIYGPNGVITKAANLLAIIVGIAAVIVMVIAGIQYMLSTGDATKVNNAKNAIIYALIGLVVVILARTVVVFIIGRLG